jgi:endoplasmic reticulum Man9GlcNAc2 1,2-alpha-mannosidase
MYDDAMDAVHNHLIQESSAARLIYTAELIPERNSLGEMSVILILSFKPASNPSR